MIERALISVYDKSGLEELVAALKGFGVEIVSSGGTARRIREMGYKALVEVSDYTGHPESPGGLVKTLHPKVHGGILGMRDNPDHLEMMKKHEIKNIDLIVVNLYEFQKTVAREGVTLEEAIENIDIGGPAMLRSSAKNFRDVTVIMDPHDYDIVLQEMASGGGSTTLETRFRLAKKVFQLTHDYDGAISKYLSTARL